MEKRYQLIFSDLTKTEHRCSKLKGKIQQVMTTHPTSVVGLQGLLPKKNPHGVIKRSFLEPVHKHHSMIGEVVVELREKKAGFASPRCSADKPWVASEVLFEGGKEIVRIVINEFHGLAIQKTEEQLTTTA